MPSKKKCVIKNYIPHSTPLNPNFYKWYNKYENHLIDLYVIFIDIIKKINRFIYCYYLIIFSYYLAMS